MAKTFTCLHYHVVFSTKHREPWIKHAFEERLVTDFMALSQNLDDASQNEDC